jgi:two-component system sensor histidine kinase BarA
MVLGPFLYHTVAEVPASLFAVDPSFEAERARHLLERMPRVRPDTIGRIARHMRTTLDLIMWSGHKQMLTTQLHLASVKESYRELQEKNAKLQETYDRLKELDRLKSNFLATVSHELRTPLTSIIGYSEMLSEGIAGELNVEQKDFVETIHEKGEQLLGLIMSLLDLSKLESGTMSMRRRMARVDTVLRDAMSTVLPAARRKNVEIVGQFDDGMPELRADPERLRQVVVNLLDNAVKFTPGGGRVRLSARGVVASAAERADEAGFSLLAATPDAVEIRVVDNGIGVPEGEALRIFDAFYQVDSSSTREHGGAGLGLAIVKRILEAHGGSVRVVSKPGEGATFVVLLPVGEAFE